MKKRIVTVLIIILLILNIPAYAHSGRTDSSGGHKDNQNKSGLGYYHYHCGGYPAHLHKDGECPYRTPRSTTSSYSATAKSIQTRLNGLGYNCGVADGIIGPKTKEAIKKFQKDNKLTVDGIVGPQTKKALGI